MNGQADEFCLVEPLASTDDDIVETLGLSQGIERIAFASAPEAPDTPIPPPFPPTASSATTMATAIKNNIGMGISNGTAGGGGSGSGSGSATAGKTPTTPISVLADDELWGPPAGARRPFQARGAAAAAAAMAMAASSSSSSSSLAISPPWTDPFGEDGGDDGRVARAGTAATIHTPAGGGAGERGVEVEVDMAGAGGVNAVGMGAAEGGARAEGRQSASTPRRKRTSGINRERQFGSSGGGGGSRFGGAGRRRAGPGNGKGGLSKKTLNIVTNLKSHTASVRSRQEMEEVEEEKRLAEEERRFKENLRQKGDDFDHTIRILLLGDSGVGKTSLMLRFSEDKFAPTMISTAGVDFKVQTLDIHGKRVRCQIWDTAGQEKFHVITRAYYRGAHGIALAYDVTDGDSFKNVNYWMANIQTHADPGQRIQKMILGNKVDIEERAISTKDGQDVAKEFDVRFFEVSAKNGYGVSDAFFALAVDIVHAVETANKKGDDERRGSRIFGSGAARLRSLASRKPSFISARKAAAGAWSAGSGFGGRGSGAGAGAGSGTGSAAGSGSGSGSMSESGGGEAGGGSGAGGGTKPSAERCKVS